MTVLFASAVLAGSALMFWVEPLIGRMLLPLLGGTPAVWNTCMVFFQAMLLAGYLLAHALVLGLSTRARLAAHAALVLAPLAVLPLGLPAGAAAQLAAGAEPGSWLWGTLLSFVGLPFLALASTAPLLQAWAARSGDARLADPYPLYAMSNVGSMLALGAFPFLLEPNLTLAAQLTWWSRAYAIYAALSLAAAGLAARGAQAPATPALGDAVEIPPGRRLRWVLWSMVPSSLLLGVTAHIALDIAAVPLLWILPLVIYLLTFVVAFARAPVVTARGADRAAPLLIAILAGTLAFRVTRIAWVPLHLAAFGVVALVCHLRLAEDRPPPARLTGFYLCTSLGGVLGGLFNAMVAPLLFDRLLELPLMLVAACFLRPPARADAPATGTDGWLSIVIGALCVNLDLLGCFAGEPVVHTLWRLALVAPLFLAFRSGSRRTRFALAIFALLATAEEHRDLGDLVLHRERTFFGVLTVVRQESIARQKLVHGQILHGAQRIAADGTLEAEPLAYFHRDGPCGELFAQVARRPDPARVGVVGLGAGSLAAYARPGERWRFYEIDPAVIAIAKNPAYFTYLTGCHAAEVRTVTGDARLVLAAARPATHDLLILDAFTSDAVPVHLLTREALALYLEALAPAGLLVFQISNLYLDMEPLLAELAHERGLAGRIRRDNDVPEPQLLKGQVASVWVVLARSDGDLGALARSPRWKPLARRAGVRAWTDDYSSLLAILR